MTSRQRQANTEGEQPIRQYKEYNYAPYTPQEAFQQKTFGTVPHNQNPPIYTNPQTTLPTPMTGTTCFSGDTTPLLSSSSGSLIIVQSNSPSTKTSRSQPQFNQQYQSQPQFNQQHQSQPQLNQQYQSQPQFNQQYQSQPQFNQQYQSQPQLNQQYQPQPQLVQQQQKVTIYVMTKSGGCIPINIPLEYLRMHVSKSDFDDIALLQ